MFYYYYCFTPCFTCFQFKLVLAHDGSGQGAALVAAVAGKTVQAKSGASEKITEVPMDGSDTCPPVRGSSPPEGDSVRGLGSVLMRVALSV